MLLALMQVRITFHDMCTCVSANNISLFLILPYPVLHTSTRAIRQLLRFERIVSSRFSPLSRSPLRFRSTVFFQAQLRSIFRPHALVPYVCHSSKACVMGHSKTYRHRMAGGANGWAERRCLYCECLCHQCLYLLHLILLLCVFSANKLHRQACIGCL